MKRKKQPTRIARRREVARLRAEGQTVDQIAAALRSNRDTVRRDILALGKQAGDGPAAAAVALFLDDAECVIQKVRRLLHELEDGDKREGTLYLNLLKLEWSMLIKFAELLRNGDNSNTEDKNDDDEDWSKYPNEKLLAKAKELGIDTTGFERALRLANASVGDAA